MAVTGGNDWSLYYSILGQLGSFYHFLFIAWLGRKWGRCWAAVPVRRHYIALEPHANDQPYRRERSEAGSISIDVKVSTIGPKYQIRATSRLDSFHPYCAEFWKPTAIFQTETWGPHVFDGKIIHFSHLFLQPLWRYTFFSSFAIFNILTGIFVERAVAASMPDREQQILIERRTSTSGGSWGCMVITPQDP